MREKISVFFVALIVLCSGNAGANWQYPGTYVGDGWYDDDGSRFVVSARGGASYSMAKIKNQMGTLPAEYYFEPSSGVVVTKEYYMSGACDAECQALFEYAGVGDLATLPAKKNYSAFSFAAGFSIGWTLPYSPQWRIEGSWDRVAETDYNEAPLFDGDLLLTGGYEDLIIRTQSGGVQSQITTDVISAMVFYDFFDGLNKPLQKFIPYVGIGVGYADTKTVMNLSDLYGDLSTSVDLRNFGTEDEYGVIQFYRSETHTSNISGTLATGVSYGLDGNLFFDLGARVTYIPKIKWDLSNEDDTKHRSWFDGRNLIYANIMLGLRFEF